MRALLGAAALLAAACVQAQGNTSIGLRAGVERLSSDSPDWQERSLHLSHAFGKRHLLDAAATRTERFGLDDNQFALGYAVPLTERLTATLDANVSDTHRVLARHAYGGVLQYEFAPAWLVHGGVRSTRYNDVRVNQGLLMLERYVGAFSWALGWRPARAFRTTAHGIELRGGYYYGERNSAALILAGGKEAASIGGEVVLTTLRSVALTGRHWISDDWAVNWSAGRTRQGDFYSRNGINLGLQYTF
ncbi:YaiO family outer membrane beta-barrel protein [Noviherbaspirillum aridicola]|uniref:YaiO beta-barrel domain-containing protein n=1 Tax=Noviherbaspirillum aridicola TaxID=2849687 RepID=A0ABQ4Q938_9BURK|nr:YaiO family outer membrane beta-barrel protein [Noviherbaspirillum aridicola]GIZ53733.1 hypothetical protein NCCP691_37470 [Noviherbaspirillum aridicola]